MNEKSSKKTVSSNRHKSPRIDVKTKTGRRANKDERLLATEILKHYSINKDPQVLLNALERFAENGTLIVNQINEQGLMLAMKHLALRDSGLTVEMATKKLVEEEGVSEITVKRRIAKATKNAAEISDPLMNVLQKLVAMPYKKKKKRG